MIGYWAFEGIGNGWHRRTMYYQGRKYTAERAWLFKNPRRLGRVRIEAGYVLLCVIVILLGFTN